MPNRIGAQALAIGSMLLCLTPAAGASEPADYRIARVVPLADGGIGWDHLSIDSANRHVFIGRGPAGLTVLDADTGAFVGSVAETAGSHGASVAADLGLGFSDNGNGGDVTIFDLKTLKPLGHVVAGETTDGVFYDPWTKTVLVNNGETGRVTLFDPITRKVLADLDLETKKPEFAVANGKGEIFIDLQDRNAVARIDMRTRAVTAAWTIAGCELPSSIAYDPQADRLLVGCRGKAPVMAAVDAATGRVVATVPIGLGNDWAEFDPATQSALFANGQSATLTIVAERDAEHFAEAETVGTRPLSRTGALDPVTGTVFLMTAQYHRAGPGPDNKPGKMTIEPGTAEVVMLTNRAKR